MNWTRLNIILAIAGLFACVFKENYVGACFAFAAVIGWIKVEGLEKRVKDLRNKIINVVMQMQKLGQPK